MSGADLEQHAVLALRSSGTVLGFWGSSAGSILGSGNRKLVWARTIRSDGDHADDRRLLASLRSSYDSGGRSPPSKLLTDDRTPRPSANRTSTTIPAGHLRVVGDRDAGDGGEGQRHQHGDEPLLRRPRRPRRTRSRRCPSSSRGSAFQPAMKSTGGRARSASRAASDASFPALAMLGPAPIRIRPMAKRPTTMNMFEATALRTAAHEQAQADAEQAGDGGPDPRPSSTNTPPTITAAPIVGKEGEPPRGKRTPRRRRRRRGRPTGPPAISASCSSRRLALVVDEGRRVSVSSSVSIALPPRAGQSGVKRRGQVVAGTDADHLAAERTRRRPSIGVVSSQSSATTMIDIAASEQHLQLAGLCGDELRRDQDVVGVALPVANRRLQTAGEGSRSELGPGEGVEHGDLLAMPRAGAGQRLRRWSRRGPRTPRAGGGPPTRPRPVCPSRRTRTGPRRRGCGEPGRCRG